MCVKELVFERQSREEKEIEKKHTERGRDRTRKIDSSQYIMLKILDLSRVYYSKLFPPPFRTSLATPTDFPVPLSVISVESHSLGVCLRLDSRELPGREGASHSSVHLGQEKLFQLYKSMANNPQTER